MFLPTGVGALIAIFVYLAWDSYYTRALKAGKGWAQVEEYRRLPLACLGGPLFAISEFWLVSSPSFLCPSRRNEELMSWRI